MDFQYSYNVDSDEPIILVNKHIGGWDEKQGMGIDGAVWQQELIALDAMGKKRIQCWINSAGGGVLMGYNMINAVLKTKTRVDTYCVGMAASIAGVLFQCGNRRIMADYGILMYHNAYNESGKPSPLSDTITVSLNTLICQRTGMSSDAVKQMMDRTTFISADEAVTMNLCDTVEDSLLLNKKYAPKAPAGVTNIQNFCTEANAVLNKFLNPSDNMEAINAILNLAADAGDAERVQAIEALKTQATQSEGVLNQLKQDHATALQAVTAKLTAAESANNELQQKLDAGTTALQAEQQKATDATNAYNKLRAENFAAEQVALGKVKNEAAAIAEVVNKATADYDGTKALYDTIPGIKQAAKIPITKAVPVSADAGKLDAPVFVAQQMIEIQNRLTAAATAGK